MRRIGRSASAALFALLLVSSCQGKIDVALASANERIPNPGFVLSQDNPEGKVYVVTVTNASNQPVWKVLGRYRAILSSFQYGQLPEGFATDKEPEPLVPGQRYRVEVVGSGGSGYLKFAVDADGKVSKVD